MSYNTRYWLKFEAMPGTLATPSCKHAPSHRMGKFCSECGVPVKNIPVDDLVKGYLNHCGEKMQGVHAQGDACAWYCWEQETREMSRTLPGILFTLRGEGEESGDSWCAYFLDGKMQQCKAQIIFPSFDMTKLK